MYESGEVILAHVPFTDAPETKIRPGLVLFEELGNIVIAGITSNPGMKGVPLTREEGAAANSVIKLNYIFTVSSQMVIRKLFRLDAKKRKVVYEELLKHLNGLQK